MLALSLDGEKPRFSATAKEMKIREWAVFYNGEFETSHLLNENILKKKFQL